MSAAAPECLTPDSAPARRHRPAGRGVGLVLAALVLAGLAIRGHHLSARSLWFDEAFSWKLIQFPVSEMFDRAVRDNNPPLYYLLLKAWAAVFGDSAFALRALSVGCGCLTVAGMYLFAAEAFRGRRAAEGGAAAGGRETGLVVAALVALNVFQVRWACEARMYTLGTALAALSGWALFRALHDPGQRLRPWLLYALFTLLFAYTHYYALFSIIAQAVFVAGYLLVVGPRHGPAVLRNRLFRNAALAGAVVAAGWSPWLPYFLRQRAQVQADFWVCPVTWVDVPKCCFEMFVDPQDAVLSPLNLLAAAALGGVGLLALRWRARGPHCPRLAAGEWYALTAAFLPFAAGALVSFLGTRVFDVRYFLFAHLFLLTGLGVLLGRGPSRAKRGFAYAVVLGAFLLTDVNYWRKLDVAHKPGAREAAAWIARHRRPGEPVVVCSPLLFLPMLHHAADRADYYVWGDPRKVPHYHGTAALSPADFLTPERLRAFSGRRLWAVDLERARGKSVAVPVPAPWLAKAQERFPEVYRFQGTVRAVEYEPAKR